MDDLDLFKAIEKVWWKVDEAKQLVDQGKEVFCSQRLQGSLTVLSQLLDELGKKLKNELVPKDNSNVSNG